MVPRQDDEVTYESLVNKWKREVKAGTVTKLDRHFYQSLDAHLRGLAEDYQREHQVNPGSPRVAMLQDELRNLMRVRDDLYDLREKKIAVAALVAARGGNPDRGNFTKGEVEVYEELVRVLHEGRRAMIKRGERDVTAGQPPAKPGAGSAPAPPEPAQFDKAQAAQAATDKPAEEAAKEAPLPGMEPRPPAAQAAPPEVGNVDASGEAEATKPAVPVPKSGRVIVRMTKDAPAFTASDLRTYRLAADDVVALPPVEAKVLVARGLAEQVTA